MVENIMDVRLLPELLDFDYSRIRLARLRQAAVWKGKVPDAWPILLTAPLTGKQKDLPSANFSEAFYDADIMLCNQVRASCGAGNSRSDAVPSIRANLGTGVTLATIGLQQEVFTDKMPWLKQHLSRDEVARLTVEDIRLRGDFERGLSYIRRFREILGESLPVYCMDTQGPLDLAHLIMGDDFFLALYDDPPLVHHVMEIALQIGIKTHKWMKEAMGEPVDRIHHGNGLYAENMGVRICEDTTVIISPDAIAEFAMPYTQRLAREFGGAWTHYCGRNDHLSEAICNIPEIRGINFGHIPGHESLHIFEEDMARCARYKKVYFGTWPRYENETGEAYLRRMHKWSSQGVLIPQCNAVLEPSNGNTGAEDDRLFSSPEKALDFWYGLCG